MFRGYMEDRNSVNRVDNLTYSFRRGTPLNHVLLGRIWMLIQGHIMTWVDKSLVLRG